MMSWPCQSPRFSTVNETALGASDMISRSRGHSRGVEVAAPWPSAGAGMAARAGPNAVKSTTLACRSARAHRSRPRSRWARRRRRVVIARASLSARELGRVRAVHHLELEAVGVQEQDGVVAGFVLVLGGRIEDVGAPFSEEVVHSADLLAAVGLEGEVMEAGCGEVVTSAAMFAGRRCEDQPLRSADRVWAAPRPAISSRATCVCCSTCFSSEAG